MEELLLWIQLPLLAVAAVWIVYLLALTILAAFARPARCVRSRPLLRFAWIVPAHNEETSIGRTIRSILAVDYPRDRRDIYVVADNCTDDTARVAEEAGAFALPRFNESLRGKGYALRWAFDRLLGSAESYDAFVVVDADSIVNDSFLHVMNDALQDGAQVVQAKDVVERNPASWSAEMTRIGFLLFNVVRPLGRSVFGGTAGLRGNGMCFRTSVLARYPWSAYSVSEDAEYGLNLLLHGVTVRFAPGAEVLATMPSNPRNAESQRARWEGGRLQLTRRYAGVLLRAAVLHRSLAMLDALLDLLTPAVVTLMLGIALMTLLNAVMSVLGSSGTVTAVALWSILFVFGVAHVFWGLSIAGADRLTYLSLLSVPRYALWKFVVYLKMLGSWKSNVWTRTTRENRHAP